MLSLEEKRKWAEGMKEYYGKWDYFIQGTRVLNGKKSCALLSPLTFTTEEEAQGALDNLKNPPDDARVTLTVHLL
jgi:hypothetical protein